MELKKFYIAVLLTCFNRKEKTLACLDAFFSASLEVKNLIFDIYLVDDGSTDGTGKAVNKKFPDVNVIRGNGKLFWNGGMRLAWNEASKKKYDFYLWLNDDTLVIPFALAEMFECYKNATELNEKPAIIVGACSTSPNSGIFSYGGRSKSGPVLPNGNLQPCKLINGNIVLVPKEIYDALGNLSADYTHTMGDIDYGLRAINEGFNLYTTTKYVATCALNELPAWYNPKMPFKTRWKLLHSPKGLNLKEYKKFRKKFWGWKWVMFTSKAYAKTLFPVFYEKLSKL